MDLTYKLCEKIDRGTQRCRLGPKWMETQGISIGSCVRVKAQDRSYICSAWPRKDGFENRVNYDTISNIEENAPLVKEDGSSFAVTSMPIKKVSEYSVVVVFTNVKNVNKYRSCVKYGSDQSKFLKKHVTDILRKLFIAENMCIDCTTLRTAKLYGISHIKITDISTADKDIKCGTISSNTKLQVSDVLSYEKFNMRSDCVQVLGGCDLQVRLLNDFFRLPSLHAKASHVLGVGWPHGVLVHGPSGSGKSTLIMKVAQEMDLIVLQTDGHKMFGSRPGEGEEKLRKLFTKASDLSEEAPCVVLVEDVDAMCPGRGGGSRGRQEARMVVQLAALMDKLTNYDHVLVIGTTCFPQKVDPVLRRPGRFEKEIMLGVPTITQRRQILDIMLNAKPCGLVDRSQLAESTPGFVAADLKAFVNQAHYLAATREKSACSIIGKDSGSESSNQFITMEDFQRALHDIVPSTQQGSDVLVDHRPVSWDDVGGLHHVKAQLQQAVEWPLRHGDAFVRLGIRPPSGVLLYGPPGCAKTLLVRAAASACGATFLAISGAQLHSPFVGDAERKLREVFRQARAGAPSILFLDEVDAILGKRKEGVKSGGAHERVLSTLLNEMDGVGVHVDQLVRNQDCVREAERLVTEPQGPPSEAQGLAHQEVDNVVPVDNSSVLVVAATNRPDMVDDALKRPGRLDKVICVPHPDEQARLEILRIHTKKTPLDNVNLEEVAKATEGFTGADLENLCREAVLHALTVDGLDAPAVGQQHVDAVLRTLRPSLTKEQLAQYSNLGHNHTVRPEHKPAGFDFSKASSSKVDFNFTKRI